MDGFRKTKLSRQDEANSPDAIINMKSQLITILLSLVLTGCASQRIATDDPVNRALKICGLGLDAKSSDAFKAALEFADKRGSASFSAEASQAIDTQIGILMKQADLKSDERLRIAAEEMKSTRECVVQQIEMTRPMRRSDLLEQCRRDVQRKMSPPGNVTYGVIRLWNQASGDLSDSDIVLMTGKYDTGGSSSLALQVKCDLRGGAFNESVIQASRGW